MSRLSERIGRQRGVTLVEALVVLALIGTIAAVVGLQASSSWQRSRLQSAEQDVVSFLQSAQAQAVNRRTTVFVRLVPRGSGEPARLEIAGDLGGSQVLDTLELDDYVSLSTSSPDAVDTTWPTATASPPDRSDPAVLSCDTRGRTLDPFALVPSIVREPRRLVVTHRAMVLDELHPKTAYVISVNPLWSVVAEKQEF